MPCWHIRILHNDKQSGSESFLYETDKAENDARTFATQLQRGEKVSWQGRWLETSEIREALIYRTELPSKVYETDYTTGTTEIFANKKGLDVTRDFIFAPPGKKTEVRNSIQAAPKVSSNVFVVHGRDMAPTQELARILEGLGLNPILLFEQSSGGKTIIEKLEDYSDVGFAFVLLTPDDIGGLAEQSPDLKKRARQNVVLEFGFFTGLLGRNRVYCLYKGDIELPSDMAGVSYAQFHNSVREVYWYIVKELKAAGYKVEQ
jgi:predicted nucleotide-binding protein